MILGYFIMTSFPSMKNGAINHDVVAAYSSHEYGEDEEDDKSEFQTKNILSYKV